MMFCIRALHFPHSSPVSSSMPVPAPVTSPTFSTVSAPFFIAFNTVSKDTSLHPQTEERIASNSLLHLHILHTPACLVKSSMSGTSNHSLLIKIVMLFLATICLPLCSRSLIKILNKLYL